MSVDGFHVLIPSLLLLLLLFSVRGKDPEPVK